jgi:hypothetical protein
MRKMLLLAAVLVTLPACDYSPSHTVRTLTREVPAAGASAIRLSFPVGEVTVAAADSPQVGLEVEIRCSRRSCEEAAKGVEIQVSEGDPLRVSLAGWPHSGHRGMKVRATVRVPRNLPLTAELGVGRMTVDGLGGGLRANLGVGDVLATLPEASVASVHMSSGVGDASLRTSHGVKRWSRGFIGRSVNWNEGTGKADVRVDCGVGHAKVVLR